MAHTVSGMKKMNIYGSGWGTNQVGCFDLVGAKLLGSLELHSSSKSGEYFIVHPICPTDGGKALALLDPV